MDDGGGSTWIRRAHFSHTVYHRSYSSSSLPSAPVSTQSEGNLTSGRSPEAASLSKKSARAHPRIQYNPVTVKRRSVSPHTQTTVPDTFREARAQSKLTRSITPHPRRKEPGKGIIWKLLHRDHHESHKLTVPKWIPYTSLFRHSATAKLVDHKGQKDSAWTNFYPGGGKPTAVEEADEHMIDLSELFLGLRFAHGAHSKVYHGIYRDEPVAVKIITVPDNDADKTLEAQLKKQFSGEVSLLCRLHHQNVIKFVAACSKAPVFCIVTEYLSEGSLRSYLHKPEHKDLPMKILVAFALEIARGMEYIHSQGVIHRDLKPENILIDEAFHMKIADFGIACGEGECDPFTDDPGTYRWMAPEMIKHKSYGRKVDVYSFGLILWELLSGSIPYKDMTPVQAAYAVVNKNLRPPFPEDCPPVMRSLIEQCWLSQPEKRPEFCQIVKVLEQIDSSLAINGTLQLVQNITLQDHKKGLAHWVQKLSPPHSSPTMKPKFS